MADNGFLLPCKSIRKQAYTAVVYSCCFQILDACAAPGSKTVQLIELLHGEESSGIPGNSYE